MYRNRGGLWPQEPFVNRMDADPEEDENSGDYKTSSTDTVPISVNASVNTENCVALADKPLPSRGHTPLFDGENPNFRRSLEDDRHQAPGVLKRAYARWIRSMPRWRHGLGEGWVGRKVLGRGGFGIAGLWEYMGPRNQRRYAEEWGDITFVVVKQQRAIYGKGLREEAARMKLLNRSGSQHVPRLYKRCYRDAGAGTKGLGIDSSRREVHRIFIEYCHGGDMNNFITKLQKIGPAHSRFLREDKVWAILVCLIKALMAIEYGTEDPQANGANWPGQSSVHLDIKPANIFIGTKAPSVGLPAVFGAQEHVRMPSFKIGDYGMMEVVPKVEEQTLEYVHRRSGWGTRDFLAPEQQRRSYTLVPSYEANGGMRRKESEDLPDEQRKYGSHTNVYQIGTAMYCLMTLYPSFPIRARLFTSTLSNRLVMGETIGEALVEGIFPPRAPRVRIGNRKGLVAGNSQTGELPQRMRHPYSENLCVIVLECLMQDYRLRPPLVELLQRSEEGYRQAIAAYPKVDDGYGEDFEATEVPHQGRTPSRWKSNTPAGDWMPDGVPKKRLKYRPLSIVLRRQEHDRKRFAQVRAARERLGWSSDDDDGRVDKGERNLIGVKRGVRHLEIYSESVSSEDTSESDSEASTQIVQKTAAKLMPPPPRPKGVQNPVYTPPPAKRPRVNHPTFHLTLYIYDVTPGGELGREYRVQLRADETIRHLKEQLVRDQVLGWRFGEIRIARKYAARGTDDSDLSDRMDLEEAARPVGRPNQELRTGRLAAYYKVLPQEREDVEMEIEV
ncbi:MAG: hypothetical protein M1818_004942 [Claussenomyces sp. TS43310]|nr:MAG: hypothetical protein M1818_004942 [Claussenomyces sp. TS43310]